jgi:hypothetical protein
MVSIRRQIERRRIVASHQRSAQGAGKPLCKDCPGLDTAQRPERSVDSPQKRVAWRASFLKSMGKDSAQEMMELSTVKEVQDEMAEPRETASVRQA